MHIGAMGKNFSRPDGIEIPTFLETVLGAVGTVLETVLGTVVNYIGTVKFLFKGLESAALKQKTNGSYVFYNSF